MSVVLTLQSDIQVLSLREGQMAVITKWGDRTLWPIGYPVQRSLGSLVRIGAATDSAWQAMFTTGEFGDQAYRVRILPAGATLTVQKDNE